MRATLGILNLVLGSVYTSYGVMTLIDMRRGWRTMGFSHFGAAWTAMAFTCGPHHLVHGYYVLAGPGVGGGLDLLAVAVGFPAGVIWFLLRLEAFAGGRGDRAVSGTPAWIRAIPLASAVVATFFLTVSTQMILHNHEARGAHLLTEHGLGLGGIVWPNLLLIGLYCTIGYFLARTQLSTNRSEGGWSVSGLSLTVVFPTCAMMHAAFALYIGTGGYHAHPAGLVIDWLAVPAATYFLWVVRGLYRDSMKDWNRPAEAREDAPLERVPIPVTVP